MLCDIASPQGPGFLCWTNKVVLHFTFHVSLFTKPSTFVINHFKMINDILINGGFSWRV